jgi:hypothetical protein
MTSRMVPGRWWESWQVGRKRSMDGRIWRYMGKVMAVLLERGVMYVRLECSYGKKSFSFHYTR